MIVPSMLMALNIKRKQFSEPLQNEGGVMLAAVLIFISLLLPVTLVILNTMQIETLLPTNEGYAKIASHEADKGFDMAMAALVENNQDGFTSITFGPGGFPRFYTCIADPTRPMPANFPFMEPNEPYYVVGMAKGRHSIDYLAEPWARHPDNYTYFIAERSRENELHPEFNPDPDEDEDVYSVPARWVLMNVPFGLDNHGERAFNHNDFSNILINLENRAGSSPSDPILVYTADDNDDSRFQSPALYVHTNWWESPGLPGHSPINYIARPGSYFRNTNPSDASSSIILNNDVVDALVFKGRYTDGAWGLDNENQYLNNPILQQAVTGSEWSNIHFGAGNASARNREYKPLPGIITQYPVGSTGDEFIPAWFESIVSDESSRFNLNTILTIIFQGANYDYNYDNDSLVAPIIRIDDFGENRSNPIMDIMSNRNHPNFSNYLLAQDMIAALLMGDSITEADYNRARQKARWILRNMLVVRERLDINYDADGDGEADELDIKDEWNVDLINDAILNGRGRMGDGRKPSEGTWLVYENPKDFLNDPARRGYADIGSGFRPISEFDFRTLNKNCTVYTYETEHIADLETSSAFADRFGYRLNFNELPEENEYLRQLLVPEIGIERFRSLIRWREGLVDLTGDGALNREYILQPVKDPETALTGTSITDENQPVSQITYRERNHPNFQDPRNPEFPSMLNIPDLGTLAMVPMSVRGTQIIASVNGAELRAFDPNSQSAGSFIENTEDGLSSDLDFTGSRLIFDTLPGLNDMASVNSLTGANYVQYMVPNGYHPSWSPDGTQFVFVDKGTDPAGDPMISIYDTIQEVITNSGLNAGVDLAEITFPPPTPPGDFMQAPAPDWSPTGNLIAFAGGGVFDQADPFADHTDIYIVRLSGPGAGIPYNISNLRDGQYAMYPDFSPDGEWIAYTVMDFHELFRPNPRPFKIRLQNLINNQREDIPRAGGPDLIDPDTGLLLGLELIPMAPDWDPYGNRLCFMGIPAAIPNVGLPDIYTLSRGGTDLQNISNTPGIAELFPTWGWSNTLPAYQNTYDAGNARPRAVSLPDWAALGIDIEDADITRDDNFRKALASSLQDASLAFRENLVTNQPQDWRYMDLPVIPQHVVDPLTMIADSLSFRSPYAPRLASDDPSDFLPQAYPGKVNINTAPREVLRAVFLLMFQGAVYDWNDDTGIHSSAPYMDGFNTVIPINLAYRDTSDNQRYVALAIADKYAHQVVEYRRWIYNNQSQAFEFPSYDGGSHSYSITRDTVPNNLTYPISGGRLGKNYRANPFAPWSIDNNQYTQDKPLYDPEPPFRSIADLFNIALYSGDDNQPWSVQGYYGNYGPDPEESFGDRGVVSLAYTLDDPDDPFSDRDYENFNDDRLGANALAVWGPIYQTDFTITNGLFGLDRGRLDPYTIGENATNVSPETLYYNQQRFRLFSADDFKWVSPYLTTRSYVYRVESRGIVRVSSGMQKLDVTRDKLWVVDFGRNAYVNRDTTGDTDINERALINGNEVSPYVIRAFEEIPPDGIPLTKRQFRPPGI